MLREYIDTPSSELMTKKFEGDHWGLTDILRAADRRIGRRRLAELAEVVSNPAAQKNLKQCSFYLPRKFDQIWEQKR